MDITTLHEIGDHEALERLEHLRNVANTRVERDVVELTIEMLGSRPGVALRSYRMLTDDYLPWIERRLVHRARERGTSWAGIARLLHRTRQGIRQKYAKVAAISDLMPPNRPQDPDAVDFIRRRADAVRKVAADRAAEDGDLVAW